MVTTLVRKWSVPWGSGFCIKKIGSGSCWKTRLILFIEHLFQSCAFLAKDAFILRRFVRLGDVFIECHIFRQMWRELSAHCVNLPGRDRVSGETGDMSPNFSTRGDIFCTPQYFVLKKDIWRPKFSSKLSPCFQASTGSEDDGGLQGVLMFVHFSTFTPHHIGIQWRSSYNALCFDSGDYVLQPRVVYNRMAIEGPKLSLRVLPNTETPVAIDVNCLSESMNVKVGGTLPGKRCVWIGVLTGVFCVSCPDPDRSAWCFVFFAEKYWPLTHFDHLYRSSIGTRRNTS